MINVVWDIVLLEQLQIFVLEVYLRVMLLLSLYVALGSGTYGLAYRKHPISFLPRKVLITLASVLEPFVT